MKKIVCLAFVLAVFARLSFAESVGVDPCAQGVIRTLVSATGGTVVSSNTGGGYLCDMRISSGQMVGPTLDNAVCADTIPVDASKTMGVFTPTGNTDTRIVASVQSASGVVTGLTSPFRGVSFSNLVCSVSNAVSPVIIYWRPGR